MLKKSKPLYDRLLDLDEVNQLKESLVQAIKIIKLWHGGAEWQTYFMSSPEMEEVRKSLKLLRSTTVNDLMHNVLREREKPVPPPGRVLGEGQQPPKNSLERD